MISITEFLSFVSLVCNLSAPSTQVTRLAKEACIEYYTNCAVKDDGKVDRLTLSNCNMKAPKEVK